MGADRRTRVVGSHDLLGHVARDLEVAVENIEVVRRSATTAVVAGAHWPRFGVEVRRERRRLLELQTLAVVIDGPATSVTDASVVFHHRGQLRRTGIRARLRGREQQAAVDVRDRLLADGALEEASLSLDFTRFEVRPERGRWRATLEVMGGSTVRMRLPPGSHYVRLAPDQVDALLATVAVVHGALPGREPSDAGTPTGGAARGTGAARPHLPRRA